MNKYRFCPSPTGLMHLGNARTALFNALAAQGSNGILILRIEDTDPERSETQYVESIKQDLQWLGIEWQEGPDVSDNPSIYFQSQRQAIYNQYYQQLERDHLAYPCFCTDQQLALERKLQLSQGQPPRYRGTCRALTPAQVAEKKQQGLLSSLRFKIPKNKLIVFQDLIRGTQQYLSDDIGDFIIRRAEGTAPFMFCNAIDDALMGVTHVLRGVDHLTNTPRQLLILETLQLPIPQYAHISLIVGPDGSPLSKRHGSFSVADLRQAGFLASALINYMARLGHTYDHTQLMSLAELAKDFSIERLVRAPARYDEHQLLYWQKEAVMALSKKECWIWLGESIRKEVPHDEYEAFIGAIQSNLIFPNDAQKWIDIFYKEILSFDVSKMDILKKTGPDFFKITLKIIDEKGIEVKEVIESLKNKSTLTGKEIFQSLRLALTGEFHGPDLSNIFTLLGKDKITKKLLSMVEALSSGDTHA